MPALQVRDLPQELYEQLSASAKAEHRSIAQQTTAILEHHFKVLEGFKGEGEVSNHAVRSYVPSSLSATEIEQRKERRRAALAQLEAMDPLPTPEGFPSIVEIIEEGRNERDSRLGL